MAAPEDNFLLLRASMKSYGLGPTTGTTPSSTALLQAASARAGSRDAKRDVLVWHKMPIPPAA